MISGQSIRLEMCTDNVRGDSKAIDHHIAWSKEEVSEPLEDMFPIFITGYIVIANVKIHELKWRKHWIYRRNGG